jgi:hypothetical protein
MTRNRVIDVGLAGLAGLVLWFVTSSQPAPAPTPKAPSPASPEPVCPGPDCPEPKPEPKPRRPWAVAMEAPVGADVCRCGPDCDCGNGNECRCAKRGGEPASGKNARGLASEDIPTVDLLAMPKEVRKANIASKGLGCCVFRSLDYAGWWQNVPQTQGFPEWMKSTGVAGGGYPSKVADLIPKISAARKLPPPRYLQYEGRDPSIIELALKTHRVPCVTWQGNHMLCCVYLDASRGAILDNNDPGRLHWYSRADFLKRWMKGGGGWVVVLLASGPSPPPKGDAPREREARGEPGKEPQAKRGPVLLPEKIEHDGYTWEKVALDQWALMKGDQQEGTWREETNSYYRKTGPGGLRSDWDTEPSEPPIPPPVALHNGLAWRPRGERYYLDGRSVDASEAVGSLGGEGLADDSGLPYLTLIGPAAERAKVEADLKTAPELAVFAGKYRLQSYAPSDWAVTGVGFVASGTPTIYYQRADGKALHRQDEYRGAKALADVLRRADPNYKPEADPDLSKKPSLPGLPGPLQDVPIPMIALAGAGALIFLRRPHVATA